MMMNLDRKENQRPRIVAFRYACVGRNRAQALCCLSYLSRGPSLWDDKIHFIDK